MGLRIGSPATRIQMLAQASMEAVALRLTFGKPILSALHTPCMLALLTNRHVVRVLIAATTERTDSRACVTKTDATSMPIALATKSSGVQVRHLKLTPPSR